MTERIPSIEPQRLRALLPHFEALLAELEIEIKDVLSPGIENVITEDDVFEYLQREWKDINSVATDAEKKK